MNKRPTYLESSTLPIDKYIPLPSKLGNAMVRHLRPNEARVATLYEQLGRPCASTVARKNMSIRSMNARPHRSGVRAPAALRCVGQASRVELILQSAAPSP